MKINFKPMLSPNEKTDLEAINYPQSASDKLDGIRLIFHPVLEIVSRSLKPIPNVQLKHKFRHILRFAKENNMILDGEVYSPKRTFQEITRAVMTQDFTDEKTIKKLQKDLGFDNGRTGLYIFDLLKDMEFYCFDVLNLNIEGCELVPFENRSTIYHSIELEYFNSVKQTIVNSKEEVENLYEAALNNDCEGLILKNPKGRYKFARATIKENLSYKVKPYEDFDAKIIGVTERQENTGESFTNELGASVKHNYKDNKEGLGIAACFIVDYNGHEVKPTITGSEEFRKEIWENRESYIGKTIEYKGMMVGSKDKPRHPTFLRFREDKDHE